MSNIVVEPLPQVHTTLMAASMLGDQSLAERLSERLYALSQGSPLAVTEALRLLVVETAIVRRGGRWILDNERISRSRLDEVTAGGLLEHALRLRVEKLDRSAHAVLATIAMAGGAMEFAELLDLSPGDEDTVIDAVDALIRMALVVEDIQRDGLIRVTHRSMGLLLERVLDAEIVEQTKTRRGLRSDDSI